MKPDEIKKIGIMGGGVMGGGIAQVLAIGGYRPLLRDLTQELLDKTRETIVDGRFGLKAGVERGKLSEAEMEDALSRIGFTTEMADLRDVDLLIEAIPENLELKRKVFAELDSLIRPEAIFATNTSGFALADLNQAVSRKDRFGGMHWFSPVPAMKLVEVIYSPETSEEAVACIEAVGHEGGKGHDPREGCSREVRLHRQSDLLRRRRRGAEDPGRGDRQRRGHRQGDGVRLQLAGGAADDERRRAQRLEVGEMDAAKPMHSYFFLRLNPPRPTFPADMTEAERAVMEEHAAYWTSWTERGVVVVFGPVMDPKASTGWRRRSRVGGEGPRAHRRRPRDEGRPGNVRGPPDARRRHSEMIPQAKRLMARCPAGYDGFEADSAQGVMSTEQALDAGLNDAARIMALSNYVVALVGAGISVESGIPPFRGPGGIWTKIGEPVANGYQRFMDDPPAWWEERLSDRDELAEFMKALDGAKPNAAHLAMAEMERLGFLQHIITQNIDNLHQEAGSQAVTEIHGNRLKLRCIECDARYPLKGFPLDEMPPRCPHCRGIIKTDTVMFGEPIPSDALQSCHYHTQLCDCMLLVGTSAVVYPAAEFPLIAARAGARLDRGQSDGDAAFRPLSGRASRAGRGGAAALVDDKGCDGLALAPTSSHLRRPGCPT